MDRATGGGEVNHTGEGWACECKCCRASKKYRNQEATLAENRRVLLAKDRAKHKRECISFATNIATKDAEIAALKAEVERLREAVTNENGKEWYRFWLMRGKTMYINDAAFEAGETDVLVSVYAKPQEANQCAKNTSDASGCIWAAALRPR